MGFVHNEQFGVADSGSNRMFVGDRFARDNNFGDMRAVNFRNGYNNDNNNTNNDRRRRNFYNDGMQATQEFNTDNFHHRASNGSFPRRDFVDRIGSGAPSSQVMQEQQPYRRFNGNRVFVPDQQQQQQQQQSRGGRRLANSGTRVPETYEILDDNNIVERSTLLRTNNNNNGGDMRIRTNYVNSNNNDPRNNQYARFNSGTNYQRQYSSASRPTAAENGMMNYSRRDLIYSPPNNNIAGNNKNSQPVQYARQIRRYQPYRSDAAEINPNQQQQQQQRSILHDRYRCHLQMPTTTTSTVQQQQLEHAAILKSSTNLMIFADARSSDDARGGRSLSRGGMFQPVSNNNRRRSLTPETYNNDNEHANRRARFDQFDDSAAIRNENKYDDKQQEAEIPQFRGLTRRRQSSYTQRELSPLPPSTMYTGNDPRSRMHFSRPSSRQKSTDRNFVLHKESHACAEIAVNRRESLRRSLQQQQQQQQPDLNVIERKKISVVDDADRTATTSAKAADGRIPAIPFSLAPPIVEKAGIVKITLENASPTAGLKAIVDDDDDDDIDMDNASDFLSPALHAESPRSTSQSDNSTERPSVLRVADSSSSAAAAIASNRLDDNTSHILKPPSPGSSIGSSSPTWTLRTSMSERDGAAAASLKLGAALALAPSPLPLDAVNSSLLPRSSSTVTNATDAARRTEEKLLPPAAEAVEKNAAVMPPATAAAAAKTTLVLPTKMETNEHSLSSFMQSLPNMLPEMLNSNANPMTSTGTAAAASTSASSTATKKASLMDFDYADPRFDSRIMLSATTPTTTNKNILLLPVSQLDDKRKKITLEPTLTNVDSASSKVARKQQPGSSAELSKTPTVKSQPASATTTTVTAELQPVFTSRATATINSTTTMASPQASAKTASHATLITNSPRTLAAARTLSFMSGLLPTTTTTNSTSTATTTTKSSSAAASAEIPTMSLKHLLFSKADTPVIVVNATVKAPPPPPAQVIVVATAPVANVLQAKPTETAVPIINKPPAPPVITDKDKKKFDKFLRFTKDPNGGCTTVQADWREVVEHFTAKYGTEKFEERLQLFVHYFYVRAFEEDEHGFPRHVMGILRGAARPLPCFLNFLERRHPNMSVKVGSLLNDNETLSKSLREFGGKFREGLDVLSGTSNTCGPMHAISCVGRKGEESGALLNDLLEVLENHAALRSVMPWGECSHLYGMKRGESDDGPILWIRPGEQTIAAAELADAVWRGVDDLSTASHHHGAGAGESGGDSTVSGSGGARRGGIGPRLRRELKDLGLSAYSRYSLQPQREHVYEDRTRPHADHAGGGSVYLPTAAVGILKAIQPRISSDYYFDAGNENASRTADDAVSVAVSSNENEKENENSGGGKAKRGRKRNATDGACSSSSGGGEAARSSRAASRTSDYIETTDDNSGNNNTIVAPEFVHGRVTKDVVCFDAKSQRDLSSLLQVDYFEKPVKQCAHFVSWPKLNWLRRQGIQYSRLCLEDGDIYVIPRGVVHQFNTVAAVCSIAWHVRLRQYYAGEIVPFSFMLSTNHSNTSAAASVVEMSTKSAEKVSKTTTLADAYTTTPADSRRISSVSSSSSGGGKPLKKYRTFSGSGTTTTTTTTDASEKSVGSVVPETNIASGRTSLLVAKKAKKVHHHRLAGGAVANDIKDASVKKKLQSASIPQASSVSLSTFPAAASVKVEKNNETELSKRDLKRHLSLGVGTTGSSGNNNSNAAMSDHEAKKLRKKLKKQLKQQQA